VDLKVLNALAKACRKAGIKHFKNSDMEFTLTDETPAAKRPRGRSAAKVASKAMAGLSSGSDEIQTDGLTDEELLLWSTHTPLGEEA